MIFWLLRCILISLFTVISLATFADDLKRVIDLPEAEPNCTFNYTEVNSKTIKLFPKCEKVFGIVVINQDTDLSLKQLQNAMRNMTTLIGGIHMENSSFSSLYFLTPTQWGHFDLSCNFSGVHIRNNKYLNDTNVLRNFRGFFYEDFNSCDFEISDNPILDVFEVCKFENIARLVNLKTSGNLYNCGCQGDRIPTMTSEDMKTCYTFYNGVKLENLSSSTDLTRFSSIQTIKGFLAIQNTNIQNMSFLKDLMYFDVFTKEDEVILNLKNNPDMTRLGFPALGSIKNVNYAGIQTVNIENLHPDFCLTINEFYWFYSQVAHFINLHAKVCEPFPENVVVCRFESMSKLLNNCVYIVGNIVIDSGDEEDTSKLLTLRYLIGTLTIRNTNLVDLLFLNKLKFIADLEDTRPAIQILANKNLTNPLIYNLSSIYTRSSENRVAIIQDNHPAIWSVTNETCYLFQMSPMPNILRRRDLNYTGGDCGERVEIKFSQELSLLVTVLLLFVILLGL